VYPTSDSEVSQLSPASLKGVEPSPAKRFSMAQFVLQCRHLAAWLQLWNEPREWHRCAMVLCSLLAIGLVGCSSGFTGGSIPTGRSAVSGIVVRADNPQQPIANALVKLTVTVMGKGVLKGRATSNYEVYTQPDGTFSMPGVSTDSTSSNASMVVTPPDSSLLGQSISFALTNRRPSAVIISLPPANFPLNKVASVTITLPNGPAGPKQPAIIKAQVLDSSGANLGILPDLVFDGGQAAILPNDTISVIPAANVTNPIVGSPLGTVTATVDTQSSTPPPTSTVTPTAPGAGSTGTGGSVQTHPL
jgi:hypothetical protein